MGRDLAHSLKLSVAAVTVALWSTATFAVDVNLDRFTVTRNSAVLFDDTFGDGAPPPSAPNFASGAAAAYNVLGTIPAGAESSGLLHLDSANGASTENAPGDARLAVVATLLTSNTGGATQLGTGDVLQLSGTFGLTIPSGPLYSGYGVRFSDSAAGTTHQLAQLQVQWGQAAAQPRITYIFQDFDANTAVTLGNIPLAAPAGTDQIRLTLTRPNTANSDFFASFAYLSGGAVVGTGAFDTPASMFQGETFVRAQFFAAEAVATPVPEPEIVVLMSVGGLFALLARRRRTSALRRPRGDPREVNALR